MKILEGNTQIINVHWEESMSWKKAKKYDEQPNDELYQIYGSHPIYGNNVLLYIGISGDNDNERISQHDKEWGYQANDTLTVRIGKLYDLNKLKDWSKWKEEIHYNKNEKRKDYQIFGDTTKTLEHVEALLIFANQPAYNTQHKNTLKEKFDKKSNLLVFNTGMFGSILPETSTLYNID